MSATEGIGTEAEEVAGGAELLGAAPLDEVSLDEVPLEILEVRLSQWAATIAAAEARWLGWLAVYARREGFLEWGCRTAAQWLSWKCGMSPTTAREKVRVAVALIDLPMVTAEFEAGRLSYSKVRALTRIANQHNEPDLVPMALTASGAQLEAICSGYRRSELVGSPAEAFNIRGITARANPNGTTTISWVLPTDHTAEAMNHLTAAVETEIETAVGSGQDGETGLTRREFIDQRGGIAAMRSDAAWAAIVNPPSQNGPVDSTSVTSPVEVTVIVQTPTKTDRASAEASAISETGSAESLADAERSLVRASGDADKTDGSASAGAVPHGAGGSDPVSGEVAGIRSASEVVARRSCDPLITALLEDANREPLAVGRATRLINRRLRLALERRDRRMCRFPGCDARQHLHAHHIIHWANGGPTNLNNLLLLCHHHHHLVHDGGWTITTKPNGIAGSDGHASDFTVDATFSRPNEPAVDPRPDAAWRITPFVARHHRDLGHDIQANALEPEHFGPFDLAWTTTVLHHNTHLRQHTASEDTPPNAPAEAPPEP